MASLAPQNVELGTSLSWLAFAINVTLHFSQVPLMRVMLTDASAESRAQYSALPTLYQAGATALWVCYGTVVLPSGAIVANNAIGLALSLAYAACFLAARPTLAGKAAVGAAWLGCAAGAALVYGLLYGLRPADRDAWASGITTTVTVALWASPLAALHAAARSLDLARVPLLLTTQMLGTTLVWLVVGFLLGDLTLVLCSAIGLFCSLLQVAVYVWIRARIAAAGKAGGGGGGAALQLAELGPSPAPAAAAP